MENLAFNVFLTDALYYMAINLGRIMLIVVMLYLGP